MTGLTPERVAELRKRPWLGSDEIDELLDAADENAKLRADNDNLMASRARVRAERAVLLAAAEIAVADPGNPNMGPLEDAVRAVVARIRAKESKNHGN